MIHRMDPPADPSIEPMPERIAPMLAKNGKLPRDDDAYGYEVKWDGVRAVAHVDAGHLTLTGRSGTDFTPRYPEVRAMGDALGSRRLILDGEVVAFDGDGRPSFELLQSRMHLASDSAVRRRMRDVPVAYVAFDLLWLEGHSTLALPYTDRRKLLAGLELERAELAHARAPRGRRRRRCSRRARRRASRASWPSGSTRPTSRAGARPAGSRSRTAPPRTW